MAVDIGLLFIVIVFVSFETLFADCDLYYIHLNFIKY